QYGRNKDRGQQRLRDPARGRRPENLARAERLAPDHHISAANSRDGYRNPKNAKSAVSLYVQQPSQHRCQDSKSSEKKHNGCESAPIDGRTFHEYANDLEMFDRPVWFHKLVATLYYKVKMSRLLSEPKWATKGGEMPSIAPPHALPNEQRP